MGGVFGGGSSYVPPVEEPVEEDLSEEKAREDRLEMIRRRRRGRAGTVHTSWTGDKVEIPEELNFSGNDNGNKPSSSSPSASALKSTLGG
ncbi:hypothetical protein [Curvivirga aplysinae]|uniref:hypothetical protein n=1 Tax=Curvivirga aplysinae TaxID=2529852 RepID=UPI0012BD459C|nr:hypothetical protein [Curvivirga aplysinae]MTI10737.1 hypothetical protein [Curvivirga aplysinae]